LQKAETASKDRGKASAVAINAEIRRTKARLLEEVPKLQRLAVKKVVFLFYHQIVIILDWNE
jgi:SYP7 family syntaxin